MAAFSVGAALVAGLVLGRMTNPGGSGAGEVTAGMKTARPGPWGEVQSVPITLECPEELLPLNAFRNKVTVWTLPGYTLDRYLSLLTDLDLSGPLREEMRSPEVLSIQPTGVQIRPSPRILLDLPEKARTTLYSLLSGMPENHQDLVFLLARTFDERFARSGVKQENITLIRRLTAPWGRYLVLSDLRHLLELIPDYREQVRVVRALTSQSSLLMHLRVGPGSDLEQLATYWQNDGAAREHCSLFESLARIPGGASVDLTTLLPTRPAAQLYTFPAPESGLRKDCHWSALNFFRDPPESAFGDPVNVAREIRENYVELVGDARYGDLALFFTPGGALIHSSVFIADDIVFSKNGDTSMHPWMLATLHDLHDQYSFLAPPNASLTVKFYRHKRR